MFEGVPSGAAPKISHGRFKGQDKTFVGVEMLMQITYRVDPRELLHPRNLNKQRRAVNKTVMEYWHKHMRPIHFTEGAKSKYKYARRTNATIEIKRKAFGHNLPIFQKGIAESLTRTIKGVWTTPTHGRLRMLGPWYLGHRAKRKRGGLSPDLKAELTRVDPADAMKLAHLGARLLEEKLKENKRRRLGAHVVKGK